ncbi:unnamed protein product, partial [Polarella glacialis]
AWKEGNCARATEVWAQLQQLDASPLWPLLLARSNLKAGDSEKALAVCDQALAGCGSDAPCAELLLVRSKARLQLAPSADVKSDLQQARAIGGLAKLSGTELVDTMKRLGIERRALATPASRQQQQPVAAVRPAPVAAAAPRAAASTTSVPAAAPAPDTSAANALVVKARVGELKGLFRQARGHCEEALKLVPGLPQALLCLARMQLANGAGAAAAQLLRKAQSPALKRGPARLEALSIMAAAAELAQDWDAAAEELEAVSTLAQKEADPPPAKAGWAPQPKLEDLLGRLARARWRSGDREGSSTLAQNILNEAPNQREACEVACEILAGRGDTATALAVMLRCLIAHRNEPADANAALVTGVMKRCSAEELYHVLVPKEDANSTPEQVASVSEVIGYVGLIMKEQGELLEAGRLYRKSVLPSPDNGSLCLNLMHTFALRRDDLPAMAWAERFLDQRSAGSKIPGLRLISKALRGDSDDTEVSATLEESQFESKSAFYDAIAIGFVLVKLIFLAQPHLDHGVAAAQTQGEEVCRPSWQVKLRALDVERLTVETRPSPLLDSSWMKTGEVPAELLGAGQVLAQRKVLSRLCAVLQPSRQGKELHLTPVRNEHAYFSCIQDILQLQPSQPASQESGGSLARVFVVGDSHVLPTAWQTVDLPVKGAEGVRRHILVPSLVTGAKIFHLREESNFYTKAAFWERISALPTGAPLVLLPGEIDCREGILSSVQKGKYASIQDALGAVVELYLALLKQLRKKLPSSPIFVHPVPHVLPETRFLTVAFNMMLVSSQKAMAAMKVQLLKFDSVFVETAGVPDYSTLDAPALQKLELLPGLRLDGTHMSPAYVASHLGPALAIAWPLGAH